MVPTNLGESRFAIKRRSDYPGGCENSVQMEIRRHLLNREEHFEVTVSASNVLTFTGNPAASALSYIQDACSIRMPFVSNDFDYLQQNIKQVECVTHVESQQAVLQYEVLYHTTLPQERYIAERIAQITSGMGPRKNDFLKTKAVYDYIISHVTYDSNRTMYSAYDALYHGRAVCSGCTALLYRLLCASNVPCRIITGTGPHERHAWNIAKIGRQWYCLDVTWDLACRLQERTLTRYQWFLRGSESFADHIRDATYASEDFCVRHPISQVDYYAQIVRPRL